MQWPKRLDYRLPYETRPERTLSKLQQRAQVTTNPRKVGFKSPKNRIKMGHIDRVAQTAGIGDTEMVQIQTKNIAVGIDTEVVAVAETCTETDGQGTRRANSRPEKICDQEESIQGTDIGAEVEIESELRMRGLGALEDREVGVLELCIESAAEATGGMENLKGIVDDLQADGGVLALRRGGDAEPIALERSLAEIGHLRSRIQTVKRLDAKPVPSSWA